MCEHPELNVDLLDATLAEIKAHPERHRQKSWRADFANFRPMDDVDDEEEENLRIYPERTDEIKVDYIPEPINVLPDTCNTAYCFAGMAIHLSGLRWMSSDAVVIPSRKGAPAAAWRYFVPVTGGVKREVLCMYPSDEAQILLGLTCDEATVLFAEDRSLDDIEQIVGEIKEGISRGNREEAIDWYDSWMPSEVDF
jgi:hypothetical protein